MNIVKETALYPPIEPYNEGFLEVSSLHTIYYEESGNPNGKPVVFLHGGPGSATKPKHRQFFNPDKYRIILFDQRGCGKSTPHSELRENTTSDLVEDIEKLRQHLNVENWSVFGGSWGSCLALAYVQTYPDCVTDMVVYGIFVAEKWMIDWLGVNGLGLVYPDAYEKMCKKLPASSEKERVELRKKFLEGTREEQLKAASYSAWEAVGMSIVPEEEEVFTADELKQYEDKGIRYAKIFMHYEANQCFLGEGQLIKNAHRLKNIPGVIIHGRHDLCCPMKGAWDLHKAWSEAEFVIVEDGAHRTDPSLARELIKATDKFSDY